MTSALITVSLPIFTGKPESFYISTSADSERLRSYQGPLTVDLNLPETVAFAVTLSDTDLRALAVGDSRESPSALGSGPGRRLIYK